MISEYACIIGLNDRIRNIRPVEIDIDSTLAAKRAWDLQDSDIQQTLLKATNAFLDTLFDVEPSLKFDIQFLGVPSNIITINCIWN